MAKRRKKNYRLRKSVRRTLGALFMISAIIIAAIPFPDAAAEDGSGTTGTEGTPPANEGENISLLNYKEKVEAVDEAVNVDLNLDGEGKPKQKAYKLVDIGGVLTYSWQYEYYVDDTLGGAIITDYNQNYTVDEVNLDAYVNSANYLHVTQTRLNDFFDPGKNSTPESTIKLSWGDWDAANNRALDNENVKAFKYYFATQYTNSYETACKNYVQAMADKPDMSPDEHTSYQEKISESGTANVTDIKDEALRKEYYLEYVGQYEDDVVKTNLKKEDFEYVYALKPESTTQSVGIYIMKQKNPNVTMDGFTVDTDGLLCNLLQSSIQLVGIGEKAFENVKISNILRLPEQLKYIGDYAFYKSYVNEIDINNVEHIGNRAFKESKLTKVNWTGKATTSIIGAEAFAQTLLTNVDFPQYLERIGVGAFANCTNLKSFTIHPSSNIVDIGDYAFYHCLNLDSVDLENANVKSIGEGAFAVSGNPTGAFTSFKFPKQNLSESEDLGDLIFAGRSVLQNVLMPATLGYFENAAINSNIFLDCPDLVCVEFPDTSKTVTFGNDLFKSVTNAEFYVKGPQFNSDNRTASGPRQSTWACARNDGSAVPYMYEDNYEVCQNGYLLSIDNQGTLQTCKVIKNGQIEETPSETINRLIIPAKVGENLPVKAIAQGCFTKELLEKVNGPLIIKDGSELKEIADGAFANAAFTHAYIGDSVEKIGTNAFKDCGSLGQVIFGKNIKDIGDSAFEGCNILTQVYFQEPDSHTTLSNIGANAFSTSKDALKLEIIGTVSPEYLSEYLPFTWAMDPANYVNEREGIRVCYKTPAPNAGDILEDNYEIFTAGDKEYELNGLSGLKRIPTNLTVILDNTNNLPTLVDYQQYYDIDPIIRTAFESGDSDNYSEAERLLCLSAFDIVVPSGVKSIDAKSYFNDDGKGTNNSNWSAYFQNDRVDGTSTKALYEKDGLFAGYYGENGREFPETEEGKLLEADAKGNDMLLSVVLYSVEYIPDNAFDNCENLGTVQIGDAITKVGNLPFYDCTSLNSVSFGNDNFTCENGIVYENKEDGTSEIIECLAGRGDIVGEATINIDNDPYLANAASIRERAFENCKNITSFKLTNKDDEITNDSLITVIPKQCFKGCSELRLVDLPNTVISIGEEAFADTGSSIRVTVRGEEVGLGKNAFANVNPAFLISYENSAVRDVAQNQGVDVTETLDDKFTVSFYNIDGTELIKQVYVEKGKDATAPSKDEIPQISGMEFDGWNRDFTNITENIFVLAVYKPLDGSGDSDGSGGSGGSGNGNGGSGNGNGGSNVNGGIDTNGDGVPDVDASGNKLYKLTVTNGEGSGYYPAGKTVTIKAGNAPGGSTFAYWSCSNQDLIFEDQTDWITTLTMVGADVTVVCNFTGQYTLEVEYGSGSGSYPAGAKVAISAVEAPQGRKFASWVTSTNGLNIENSQKESTIITMPESNAKITATYKDTGSISGNSTSTPSKNNTSVVITKPGISDKGTASAYVSGSTDNFVVKISESLDAADEVQKALQKKYPDMSRIKYFAMDISLYDAKGANKITDTSNLKVNITIPIPDALREYAGNNRVGAVVNGELETLNPKFTTINGVPSVTFTATHFSPYTIYVDTGNMTVSSGTLDSTPKTGDGIHPKWFLSIGLACISIILFTKKDRRYVKVYH